MTKKRLLLFVVGPGLLVLGGFLLLLWPSYDPINRENFEKIKEGMTEEDIVANLGLPPGNYSNGPRCLHLVSPSGIRCKYPLNCSLRSGLPPAYDASWISNNGYIRVQF